MEYLTDFEDCTVRQSDINALLCDMKFDASVYRRTGQVARAESMEEAMLHVGDFVTKLRGMHAARQIQELCKPAG